MNTVEPLLPRLLARGAGQIAVVSSVAGYRGLPYSPGYSASKAGVRAYGEALRALLRPRGVRVSVVVPGFFNSPMTDRFHGDKPFMVSLERASAIVRRGLDRGQRADCLPTPSRAWPSGGGSDPSLAWGSHSTGRTLPHRAAGTDLTVMVFQLTTTVLLVLLCAVFLRWYAGARSVRPLWVLALDVAPLPIGALLFASLTARPLFGALVVAALTGGWLARTR